MPRRGAYERLRRAIVNAAKGLLGAQELRG